MFNFIEQFYYGNIEPQECSSELTAQMKKKLRELTEKEEALGEKLSDETKVAFEDYVATCNAFTSICCADSFMVGFRLGAKFTYDAFEVTRRMMREIYNNEKLSHDEASKIFLRKVFEFAEENSELMLVLLGDNGSISIGEALTKYIDRFICDDNSSKYIRYCMQFISAGVSNILWLWLNEKDRMPAEKISEVVSNLYNKGMENAISAEMG